MFQVCDKCGKASPLRCEEALRKEGWETHTSPTCSLGGSELESIHFPNITEWKDERLQRNTGVQSGKHSTQRTMLNNVIQDSIRHLTILQFINFWVLDLTTLILQRILEIAIDVIIYGLHTMIVGNQVKQRRRQKNGRLSFPEYHWEIYMKSVNILWRLNVHLTVSQHKLTRKCCPHSADFKNSCKDLER